MAGMRPLTLIAAAGLIGLVAGAVVLYVSGAPSGNMTGADAMQRKKWKRGQESAYRTIDKTLGPEDLEHMF